MYRAAIIYAPEEQRMLELVRSLEQSLDPGRFVVKTKGAAEAHMPDLAASDLFLLGSLPDGGQPIHPDFSEMLRALKGITLAGRVGGVFSLDSEATLAAFAEALEDCELDLPPECFLSVTGQGPEREKLARWAQELAGRLEAMIGGA